MEITNYIKENINYAYYQKTIRSESTDFEQFMDEKTGDISDRINSSMNQTLSVEEIYYQQVQSSNISNIPELQEPQFKNLGMGFLIVGEYGYGMSASQIMNGDSDDVIVRVKISKGDNQYDTVDVNLSELDTHNATAVEMFAFCQYADANGTGVDDKWGSWHALKTFSTDFGSQMCSSYDEALTKKKNWNEALAKSTLSLEKQSTGKTMTASEVLQMLKDTIIEKHKLSAEDLEEKDWRDMSDDEWTKLLEDIDKYLEDFKEDIEKLKELQDKAAQLAAAGAPAGEKVLAAANAALQAATNGFVSPDGTETDSKWLEENSWTYEMQTDDQEVLARAKASKEMAQDALSKSQEILLTGDTTTGISSIENAKECANLKDDKETWTITAFTPEGIICKECTKGGATKDLWSINYKNKNDAQRVWDFLDKFDKDSDLKFSGSMKFWEDFLAGLINEDEIISQYKK